MIRLLYLPTTFVTMTKNIPGYVVVVYYLYFDKYILPEDQWQRESH